MNIRRIVDIIIHQHSLPVDGIHGLSHWARVMEYGTKLAELNNANLKVVQLFALFHDSRRVSDGQDPEHGLRGAEFAASLQGALFSLDRDDFELLRFACMYHTDGLVDADITVQTCWDSDRLDLGRVGIIPNPDYLCTESAKRKEIIDWANERSAMRLLPEFVESQWGIAAVSSPVK